MSTPEGGTPFDLSQLDELPGADFERAVAQILRARGFSEAELTPDRDDFGADVLATRDGVTYAVQAKRAISAVGVAAVQEVLGGMAYWGTERALVVTNAIFSPAAKQLAERAHVVLADRDTIKEWISDAQLFAADTTISPLPHQDDVLKELRELRAAGEPRALAVMASGLGKTYVAALDARQFQDELGSPIRVLYLSHQGVILQQGRVAFERVFGRTRTYGRFDGERHDIEADFLFGTFQSVYPMRERFDPTSFDYVVVDEAHHTAAPTRDAVVAYFQPRFLLGLTATPFRGDGKDISAYYGDVTAGSIPLERALVDGLLAPIDYRLLTDPLDPDALSRALASAGRTQSNVFQPQSDETIVDTVLREALQVDGRRRVLVFCASLAQMDHFAELFPNSRTISGRDSRRSQLQTVEAFNRGDFEVLLSRDVLNEGVDVPHATTLVFLRNTESAVVFLQQLGRGLRKVDGKERVVVLDFVSNIDRIEFVYSFNSRLQAEQSSRRSRARATSAPRSTLQLDQTAQDVIQALLEKKQEREFIVSLEGLSAGALAYHVSQASLRRMVDDGRLVPDFVLPSTAGRTQMFFERATVLQFMRRVQSPRFLEGLLSIRQFADRIGMPPSWVQRHQERGSLPAAWVHQRPNGRFEVFFDPDDVARYRQDEE